MITTSMEKLSFRIGAKWELKGLCYQIKDEDLKTLCNHFDVEKKAIDLVFNLARGNFRKNEKLLKRACEFANEKAVELIKHIEAAASFLILG